jgi:hypothetical protein
MTDNKVISESTAQTVVFLEVLALLLEKSPVAYNEDAAKDLAGHIRGMAEAVNSGAHVDQTVLEVTRQYAALDWHNELMAVMFSKKHRADLN